MSVARYESHETIGRSLEAISSHNHLAETDRRRVEGRSGLSVDGRYSFTDLGWANFEDELVSSEGHFITRRKLVGGAVVLRAGTLVRARGFAFPHSSAAEDINQFRNLGPVNGPTEAQVSLFEKKGIFVQLIRADLTLGFSVAGATSPKSIATEGIYRYLSSGRDELDRSIQQSQQTDVRYRQAKREIREQDITDDDIFKALDISPESA